MTQAEAFLLLTLSDATLTAPFLNGPPETSVLALECVTLPINPFSDGNGSAGAAPRGIDRDIWLVLRFNDYEMPLVPTEPILYSKSKIQFTFTISTGRSEGKKAVVSLPPPASDAAAEDLETFIVLLSQYGILQHIDPDVPGAPPDESIMKGRLVLVDEEDGNVVGALGDNFKVREDPNLLEAGREKDPVIVELPESGGPEVNVHAVSHDDFLYKSATLVSRGIIFATDMIGKGMNAAANYYVKNTTPNAQPVEFTPTTRKNLQRVHNISGQALKVTNKTTSMIHSIIDRAAHKASGGGSRSGARTPTNNGPPLPPRSPRLSPGSPPSLPPRSRSPQLSPNPPPLPPRKPGLINRVLMSTDLILTTVENSARSLIVNTTNSASTALGHRYGAQMGEATQTVGQSATNVGLVYIDARGVGRRALIRRAGKQMIKGSLGKNQQVVFGTEQDFKVVPNSGPSTPAVAVDRKKS